MLSAQVFIVRFNADRFDGKRVICYQQTIRPFLCSFYFSLVSSLSCHWSCAVHHPKHYKIFAAFHAFCLFLNFCYFVKQANHWRFKSTDRIISDIPSNRTVIVYGVNVNFTAFLLWSATFFSKQFLMRSVYRNVIKCIPTANKSVQLLRIEHIFFH